MRVPFSSEELFSGHGWKITLDSAALPDGRVKTIGRARKCDSVHILALPTERTVLLLREYRPHFAAYLWMLPSGKVDKESDPVVAAQRELREETGYRADDLQPYCSVKHSEGLVSTNHLFIARGLRRDPLPPDACELMEVRELSLDEALSRVLGSPHVHVTSAFGLLRYMRENGL